MNTLASELAADGYDVQFVLLSDANARDFKDRTEVPLFGDTAPGQPAWQEMEERAVKHDTFVYSRTGERLLFWDASSESLARWTTDIRTTVEAQGE